MFIHETSISLLFSIALQQNTIFLSLGFLSALKSHCKNVWLMPTLSSHYLCFNNSTMSDTLHWILAVKIPHPKHTLHQASGHKYNTLTAKDKLFYKHKSTVEPKNTLKVSLSSLLHSVFGCNISLNKKEDIHKPLDKELFCMTIKFTAIIPKF